MVLEEHTWDTWEREVGLGWEGRLLGCLQPSNSGIAMGHKQSLGEWDGVRKGVRGSA